MKEFQLIIPFLFLLSCVGLSLQRPVLNGFSAQP